MLFKWLYFTITNIPTFSPEISSLMSKHSKTDTLSLHSVCSSPQRAAPSRPDRSAGATSALLRV